MRLSVIIINAQHEGPRIAAGYHAAGLNTSIVLHHAPHEFILEHGHEYDIIHIVDDESPEVVEALEWIGIPYIIQSQPTSHTWSVDAALKSSGPTLDESSPRLKSNIPIISSIHAYAGSVALGERLGNELKHWFSQ